VLVWEKYGIHVDQKNTGFHYNNPLGSVLTTAHPVLA
jgi:hypothetical protein